MDAIITSMITPTPSPDLNQLTQALDTLAPAFHIRWVDTIASTNSALVEAPPEDDSRIHVLVASEQTAGRGRRGRQWLSWQGASLTFSVLWRFAPRAPVPAGLSLAVGIALASALEGLGLSDVALKWPNDVLVHGAKLAGVLVEVLPGKRIEAVIGIGVNLALPDNCNIPRYDGNALAVGALADELATPPSREALLAAILTRLHPVLSTYGSAGFGLLRSAWQQRNAFANLPVRVFGENIDICGICAGVDEDGALLIDTDTGKRRVLAGEVSLRPVTP